MVIFNNLKKLLNSLSEEKAFYAGVSFMIFIASSLLFALIFINEKAVSVPKYTEETTFAANGKIQFLSPVYANSDIEKSMSALLFSGLTQKNIEGEYVNDLAETITPNETNTQYEVKIKDSAKFDNGDDITSDDIMFTFALLENPSVDAINKVLYEGIRIEKIDDKNLTVTVKKPYPRIMEALSVGVLNKKDFEKENINNLLISDKNVLTVYSGAYYLDQIISENGYKNYVLKTNFDSASKKPYIKKINFRVYDGEDFIYRDFQNKELDLIINNNQKILLDDYFEDEYVSKSFTLPRTVSLYLNPNKKQIFADKEVRAALYHAVDRTRLSQEVLPAYSTPNYSILPASPYQGGGAMTRDAVQAIFDKKLKSDTIDIIVSQNERHQAAAAFVKKSLEDYGAQVNIQVLDTGEISNNTIKNRDFEIFLYSSEISSVYDLYAFLHSGQTKAPGANITNYLSKNLDKNLEDIKDSTDQITIDTSIADINKEFYSEYPYIPLYTPVQKLIFRKNMNINTPEKINSYKDLFITIKSWSDGFEKTYPIFYDENLIDKIYSKMR